MIILLPSNLVIHLIQFNFYDHSKVILSSHGLLVTHIDKNYKMTRWTLSELMEQALDAPNPHLPPDEAKFHQRLVDKLKYCKEVLVSICTATANGTAVPEETAAGGGNGMGTGTSSGDAIAGGSMGRSAGNALSTRNSKISLR